MEERVRLLERLVGQLRALVAQQDEAILRLKHEVANLKEARARAAEPTWPWRDR